MEAENRGGVFGGGRYCRGYDYGTVHECHVIFQMDTRMILRSTKVNALDMSFFVECAEPRMYRCLKSGRHSDFYLVVDVGFHAVFRDDVAAYGGQSVGNTFEYGIAGMMIPVKLSFYSRVFSSSARHSYSFSPRFSISGPGLRFSSIRLWIGWKCPWHRRNDTTT